jgi:hypothetical protein
VEQSKSIGILEDRNPIKKYSSSVVWNKGIEIIESFEICIE